MFKLLPSAIERNIATLFHIALTFIAAWVLVKGVKYIMISISLHALANIHANLMLQVTKDPWIIEGFIGLLLVPLSVILILIVHKAILEKSKGLETVFCL